MVKKAKQGVKVRLLVDFSAPVFQLRPVYASLMAQAGIEVKYYNTTPLYRLFSVQHRSHRKLLIVDGAKVLTGGRNIGDDYFDLAKSYNFLDSDILVEGEIAKTAQASFDLYWNSDFSESPEQGKNTPEELQKLAKDYIAVSEQDKNTAELVMTEGRAKTKERKALICNDMIFVSDFPGRGEAHRQVFSTIVKLVAEAKQEIFVESPYFVIKDDGYQILKNLTDRNVRLDILTNGLYSTDAYYVISALVTRMQWLADSGINLYVYNGNAVDEKSTSRWGVHSKRAVIDRKTVLLGTYNIDPRSANLNSELMVVCKDQPDFAEQVLQSIEARLKQSTLAISDKKVVDENAVMAKAETKQKAMVWLAVPLMQFFDFLL